MQVSMRCPPLLSTILARGTVGVIPEGVAHTMMAVLNLVATAMDLLPDSSLILAGAGMLLVGASLLIREQRA